MFIVILIKLLFFIFEKKLFIFIFIFFLVVGFQPWECWWFPWTDIAPVGPYKLKMFLTWQQISVLYLNFGVRFKSSMQYYVCSYAHCLGTDLYRHESVIIEACCAITELDNNLRVKLIFDSRIGFLLGFGWYSIELSWSGNVSNSLVYKWKVLQQTLFIFLPCKSIY